MRRGVLVEQNAVTGEETLVSQRGQDFDLRKDSQEQDKSFEPQTKREKSNKQSRANLQKHEKQQDVDSQEQNLETDIHDSINSYDFPSQLDIPDEYSHEKSETSQSSKIQHGNKYQSRFSGETSKSVHDSEVAENNLQSAEEISNSNNEKISNPNDEKANQQRPEHRKVSTTEIVESDNIPTVSDVPETAFQPKSGRLQFLENEFSGNGKLSKLEVKANKAGAKLEKAQNKLPSERHIKKKRVFYEKKGKARTKFTIEKELKPKNKKQFAPKRATKATIREAKNFGVKKIHEKIGEVEEQNVAVKASHKAEQLAESAIHSRTAKSALQYVKDRPYRRVTKLENKYVEANKKLNYQKNLTDNPKLKSNSLSRMVQKQKIKREYARMAHESQKLSEKGAKKTGNAVIHFGEKILNSIKKHPKAIAFAAILALFLVFIMSSFSSCSTMLTGGLNAILASSYLADDTDIDYVELMYTEWETDLQMQILNAESDYPGYDEYRYNVGDIGHNPYELMAYLTVKYQDFSRSEAEADLRTIFETQYLLAFAEEIEIRYRTETHIDPNTGNTHTVEVPYDYYILNVTVTARSFTDIISPQISEEQKDIFDLLMQTKGNRQYVANPFDFNWLPYVSSYYGYRVHPISGEKDYHKGVDIALPIGTEIRAGFDGTVTAVGFDAGYGNYIVIENDKGIEAKYAHCDTLILNLGQSVQKGDVIATVGNTGNSTGPHLYLEVLKNGEYLNPAYFAETGDDGSSLIPPGFPGGVVIPPYSGEPMGDGSYAALLAEAQKFVGFPYVWGGSSPATSFDCSGYICFILNQSGVANVGRTTAQGLYNLSTPVAMEDAKPGDLLFFHSTFSSPNTVTHVALYLGDDTFIHAGNPIGYASLSSPYWQKHFYAAGRLSG